MITLKHFTSPWSRGRTFKYKTLAGARRKARVLVGERPSLDPDGYAVNRKTGDSMTFDGCTFDDLFSDKDQSKRTFTQASRAWYGRTTLASERYVDEFMINARHPDGSTRYEFSIEIHKFDDPAPRLCLFEDSWAALTEMADLMSALADLHGTSPSALDIRSQLVALGFEDVTETDSPRVRAGKPLDASEVAECVARRHGVAVDRVTVQADADGNVTATIGKVSDQ